MCCQPDSQPAAGEATAAVPVDGAVLSERARVLGSFLDSFWRLPLPAQGARPAGLDPAEASLDPALCGACHPRQEREWRGSLHARAFSPGFAGQLVEGALAAPAEIRRCQTCHAPLGEQQPFDAALAPHGSFDPKLRAQGIVCAACHVRAHRRYGPPRRPELRAVTGRLPHGGFEPRSEFGESRFCAPCHQFFDDAGVNGKPIENTYVEWAASPQAAAGRTCQSCHMPDRAHTWRGIHDPEMVRSAVDVDLVLHDPAGAIVRAALVLTSRDVGHAFPSYVTPRVFLAAWQVDRRGRALDGTRRQLAIGREVDLGSVPMREIFDNRVSPGQSAALNYAVDRDPNAVALIGRVTVDPDFHYRGVFASLAEQLADPAARELIERAVQRTAESSYVLSEIRGEL